MDSGDLAPDFELPDDTGAPRRLSALLEQGPVVLFFYPAALTKGCTIENCHFRDLAAEFAALGAQRVGISGDAVERQERFSERYGLDFPLLSDVGGSVARQFGVRRAIGRVWRRTFVIDTDRRILEVIKSEIRMGFHGDRALEVLRAQPAR